MKNLAHRPLKKREHAHCDQRIESVRRYGATSLPPLLFPLPKYVTVDPTPDSAGDANRTDTPQKSAKSTARSNPWIEDATHWACMNAGLGEYARFALIRYLGQKGNATQFDPKQADRVVVKDWLGYVNENFPADQLFLKPFKQSEFDSQVVSLFDRENINTEMRVKRLRPLFEQERLWPILADAANRYHLERRQPWHEFKLDPRILLHGRFAGRTAPEDFIFYCNTGIVPPRQAPFPDELSDLGISLEAGFRRDTPYYESKKRRTCLLRLAKELALAGTYPLGETGTCRISSLWNDLHFHGLIAGCARLIEIYQKLCIKHNYRRLPIIYVPVGLNSKHAYVSRRAVVWDLHTKICIRRAGIRGETPPRELSDNPTEEQVSLAIKEIRAELARDPALVIFGIHRVPLHVPRPVADEILDAPLPYILDRLMAETGLFGNLAAPRNAYASQFLILADGPLATIANVPVQRVEYPPFPAERFTDLLRDSGCERLKALQREPLRPEEPLYNVSSSKVELTVLESTLALAERAGESRTPDGVADRALRAVWGPNALRPGKDRVEQILSIWVDQVLHEATQSVDGAWFATLFHLVSLLPGGLRLLTQTRVLISYVIATTPGREDRGKPASPPPLPPLWRSRVGATTSQDEIRDLEKHVRRYLGLMETRAAGLLRKLPSAFAMGFDECSHPFEAPEVHTLQLEFGPNTQNVEFLSPLVRRLVCEEFRRRAPEKHALLHRLLAEEFVRRAGIVQCHCAELQSLVDQRYTIIAIYCALQSLKAPTLGLLTEAGRLHSRWLIPTHSRIRTYHWIYRRIYDQQLNGGVHALSEQHGAESLKCALLEEFLETNPLKNLFQDKTFLRTRGSRSDLRQFNLICEILHALIYVSARTADSDLAIRTFERLDQLIGCVEAAIRDPMPSPKRDPGRKNSWSKALARLAPLTAKLRLDAAASYAVGNSIAGTDRQEWSRRKLFRDALRTLDAPAKSGAFDPAPILAILAAEIRKNRGCPPQTWCFAAAVLRLRRCVAEKRIQCLYDYLCRYAELVAGVAELLPQPLRVPRRQVALIIFELADALRRRFASTVPREQILHLSSRPARNAARLCLGLGKALGASWYFKQASYYCSEVLCGQVPPHMTRIALLIIQAMTIRVRGSADQMSTAMKFLKTAECALLQHPDRTQLWIRFYLERAKLFRDRALQPDVSDEEVGSCIYYCKSDVNSVLRLARNRQAWVERALLVQKDLPERSPGRRPEWSPHGTLAEA